MSARRVELVPARNVARTSPGPATDYFTQRLRELIDTHAVRDTHGRTKRLNRHSFAELLQAQAKARAVRGVSQTEVYRLVAGDGTPTLDVLYEVAQLFKVSPRSLVPE